ncbi:MAG: glycoside hydrolase 43 family protein [Clostridiales bacterium]|nr:glycoside hydrolase 43 family protein [Clostridiales bacterium]
MERLWKSDLGDGTYCNPILFADYSDPDVIRVKDTFYMTASSFQYVPGLPILVSHDLVNWKLANYAVDCISAPGYEIPQHAKGVWAPAIRFHEGYFYIYYGMPDEGIFMVRAVDPLGKWEEPVLVLKGKGLIDPCPFWDDDGSACVVHGYAKSRIGFKSHLGIFPMTRDGRRASGEDHILYCGLKTQPTIEGPKVYKRNGFYYIFAPAGGVKNGWQTVLRARQIEGPYEEKIVMRQGSSPVNGPHQGGLVDTGSGEEWFLHFQDCGLYGRIVHLQPVSWENDWPLIGIRKTTDAGEPYLIHVKPKVKNADIPCYLEASDDFDGGGGDGEKRLNLMWQWMGNPAPSFYSLQARDGFLRLYCQNPSGKPSASLWEQANVLTQKLICPFFEAVSCLYTGGLREGCQAGMVMLGEEYAYVAVRKFHTESCFLLIESKNGLSGKEEEIIWKKKIPEDVEKVFFTFTL